LRDAPLYFYPASATPRAWLFFFGNDVGFWSAHQQLATRLASSGISVVGVDPRPILRSLPDDSPEHRAAAYRDTVTKLIAASRHELHADDLPVILGGHSIGAELAIYTAANVTVPGLRGVLAMSAGRRGHLRISLGDITNSAEPTEPGSFDVPAEVCAVPHDVRVAIIRGSRDRYAYADSAFAREGGDRLAHWAVPFAGHSLKGLTLAWPIIARSVAFLLASR
jgi:pimeloyl-ACP methyl ester carboxylesterase